MLNVIINNGRIQIGDREALFPDNETVLTVDPDNPKIRDVWDLLVIMCCFKSRGQARKNWKGPKDFPSGWSEFFIGKRKQQLCIWNPSE